MIERGSAGGLSYVKVVTDRGTVLLIDLYAKLDNFDENVCSRIVELPGNKLCFIDYNGCRLVVSIATKGDKRMIELIGGEAVVDSKAVSPVDLARRCAQAASERLGVRAEIST